VLSETQPVEPVSGATPEMSHSKDADVVFEILKKEGIGKPHHGGAADAKLPGNIQEARKAGGALPNLNSRAASGATWKSFIHPPGETTAPVGNTFARDAARPS